MTDPGGAGQLIAVTGATGELGGRVARRLAERGVPQRLVVRDPSRAPRLDGAQVATAEYRDGDAMGRALQGVRTLFLVSGGEAEDRLDEHRTAVDAAADAGVERVVYTSFLGPAPDATFTFARDHFHTEERLRTRGLTAVALRNGLYADLLPFFAADGAIRGPAGEGRFAPVARDDISDVAVTVLMDERHDGTTLDVTGADRVTMRGVADLLTELTRQPVRYEAETLEEAYASRASYGAPEFAVTGWVTSYQAIAKGDLDVVSDTVQRLTGRPPTPLREVLRSVISR